MLQFLLPLVQAGATILSAVNQRKAAKIAQQPTAAEARSSELYDAILNPDSPTFKRLQDREQQSVAQDFLSQIRAMQLADRREASSGRRGTFFNPERADEAVSYMISRGLPAAQAQARNNVADRLAAVASGQRGLIDQQVNRQQAKISDLTAQPAAITSILREVQKLFPQQQDITWHPQYQPGVSPMQNLNSGETIYWNRY